MRFSSSAKRRARDVDPAEGLDVRGLVELAAEGGLERRLRVDRAADRQMVPRASARRPRAPGRGPCAPARRLPIQRKRRAGGGEVLVLGPGVDDRRRVRHLEHRLAGEGVGRVVEVVAEQRRIVGGLDRAVDADELVAVDRDAAAVAQRQLAGEHRGVVDEPVRGVEVRDLDAVGVSVAAIRAKFCRAPRRGRSGRAAGSGVRSRLITSTAKPSPSRVSRIARASPRLLCVTGTGAPGVSSSAAISWATSRTRPRMVPSGRNEPNPCCGCRSNDCSWPLRTSTLSQRRGKTPRYTWHP